jgi:hypothetical protein
MSLVGERAAFAISVPPNTSVPALPATSLAQTDVAEQAVLDAPAGTLDVGTDYPLPKTYAMPAQETLPNRPPVPPAEGCYPSVFATFPSSSSTVRSSAVSSRTICSAGRSRARRKP